MESFLFIAIYGSLIFVGTKDSTIKPYQRCTDAFFVPLAHFERRATQNELVRHLYISTPVGVVIPVTKHFPVMGDWVGHVNWNPCFVITVLVRGSTDTRQRITVFGRIALCICNTCNKRSFSSWDVTSTSSITHYLYVSIEERAFKVLISQHFSCAVGLLFGS